MHLLSSFFFLMIRRPPRSTLFPTRRSSDLVLLNTGARAETIADYLKIADGVIVGNLQDRKSTRLNSSHSSISYAVFCLKKKKQPRRPAAGRRVQPAQPRLQSIESLTPLVPC